jgi:hypothetical protein
MSRYAPIEEKELRSIEVSASVPRFGDLVIVLIYDLP